VRFNTAREFEPVRLEALVAGLSLELLAEVEQPLSPATTSKPIGRQIDQRTNLMSNDIRNHSQLETRNGPPQQEF
jgi:hypothetical protein